MQWPKIFTRKSVKSASEDDRGWYQWLSGVLGYSQTKYSPIDLYTGFVARAIDVRSDAGASTEFQVFRRATKNNKEELVLDHPVLTLLDDVNDYFTKYDLLKRLNAHLDLYGNEFWLIIRGADKKTPYEILPLDPTRVSGIFHPITYVSAYRYMQYSGGFLDIPVKDIIHFKESNPFNDISGYSLIDKAAQLILGDKYLTLWNKNFYQNSAMPDVALEFPQSLNEEQVRKIRLDWQRKYQGVERGAVPAVLHSGAKVNKLTTSIADMAMVNQQNSNRDNILAMFGVPKTMVGLLEEVNLANAKTSDAVFVSRTMLPRNKNIANTLSEFLLYQFEPDADSKKKKVRIYDIRPVVEAVSDIENTNRNQIQYTSGVITKNEWRASEGKSPVKGFNVFSDGMRLNEQGEVVDDLLVNTPEEQAPALEDVLTEDGKVNKDWVAKAVGKGFDNLKKKDIGEQVSDLIAVLEPVSAREMVFGRLKKQNKMAPEVFESTGAALKAKQDTREDKYVKEIKTVVMGLFKSQINRALDNLETPKKDIAPLLDKNKEIKLTIDLLTPILSKLVVESGKETLDVLNAANIAWNLRTPSVASYIKGNTKLLANSMTDTTMKAIRMAIASGIDAEEGIDEITQRILNTADLGESRATTIALSETHRGGSYAEVNAMQASGVVSSKVWFASKDERDCDDCDALNGTEVGISEPFLTVGELADIGYDNYDGDVEIPMLHPNCRCTIIPVLK